MQTSERPAIWLIGTISIAVKSSTNFCPWNPIRKEIVYQDHEGDRAQSRSLWDAAVKVVRCRRRWLQAEKLRSTLLKTATHLTKQQCRLKLGNLCKRILWSIKSNPLQKSALKNRREQFSLSTASRASTGCTPEPVQLIFQPLQTVYYPCGQGLRGEFRIIWNLPWLLRSDMSTKQVLNRSP